MIRIQRLHCVTIALGAAMYAGGGNPTTSTPVSGVCRTYASSVTSTTTTTNTFPFVITSTQNITSSYDTATNRLSATGTATSSLGCQYSGSWSTNYGSVADFIDEVSVVPQKTRWATRSATVTHCDPVVRVEMALSPVVSAGCRSGERPHRALTAAAGISRRAPGPRGKGFENLALEGGKGFEKPHSRGGKGLEKVVRKGSLRFENRQKLSAAQKQRASRCS